MNFAYVIGDDRNPLLKCYQFGLCIYLKIGCQATLFDFNGSPGRARTADLVINSHPLYRLSYRGITLISGLAMVRFSDYPVNL